MANRFSKKTAVLIAATTLSLCVVGGSALSLSLNERIKAGANDQTYNLTIDGTDFANADSASLDGWVQTEIEVKSQQGTDVTFMHYGVWATGSTGFASINPNGYIANVDKLTSVSSVTVDYDNTNGTLLLFRGWYTDPYSTEPTSGSYEDITWQEEGQSVRSGTAIAFSGIAPNYIKIVASSENTDSVAVNSISYEYSCNADTSLTNQTFRIDVTTAPTVVTGDSSTIVSENNLYAWVAVGDSTFDDQEFTKRDNGTFYLDLTGVNVADVSTAGTFQITIWVDTAGGIESWDYKSNYDRWGYGSSKLSQGQTAFYINDLSFSSQPNVTTSGHSLTVNANITHSQATPVTTKLLWATSSFTSASPNWNNEAAISNGTTTVSGIGEGTTVYLMVYVWVSSGLGNQFGVADSDGNAYAFTVSADTVLNVSVAFDSTWQAIASWTVESGEATGTCTDVSVADISTYVYGGTDQFLSPSVTFEGKEENYTLSVVDSSLDNVNLRIEGKKIVPLKADTETQVKLTTVNSKFERTFTVTIVNRAYDKNYDETATGAYDWESKDVEDWFDENGNIDSESISKVSTSGQTDKSYSDFAQGVDISSSKALYENGARYYTADGIEQSLFYLLKDAGVNWVRLRLWNDPTETYDGNVYEYGGGGNDLERTIWMAHEARAAGLKVLLDFHYSDFFADPLNQIVPKAWLSLGSVSAVSSALKEFTRSTIVSMYEADAVPDMVQIGNEITSGMLRDTPNATNTVTTTTIKAGNPSYVSDRERYGFSYGGTSQMATYIAAGSDGIDEAISQIGTANLESAIGSTDIKKMIHYTSTLSNTTYTDRFGAKQNITNFKAFVNRFDSADYDVIGLSAYPFYDFQTDFTQFESGFKAMCDAYPSKEVMVVETSLPFTYWESGRSQNGGWNDYTSSAQNGGCDDYPRTIVGQAKMLRDMTDSIYSNSNGTGLFYWEPAWIPIGADDVCFVGIGDYGSDASWANQALFSFGGKALGSLKAYSLMNPNA